jgi:hypothetical protein
VRLDEPIFFSSTARRTTPRCLVASRPRKSEVVFDFIVEDRPLSPAEYTPTSPPA